MKVNANKLKVVALACALMAAGAAFGELKDGWTPKFYSGLEAVGSVEWAPKAYKDKVGAIRCVWESGALKFGAAKEVTTDLTGYVDWTIEAYVKSEGDYGYAGAAMEFLDERGKSVGLVTSPRPSVSKGTWRKMSWTFSAPKSAKRYVAHVLSLNREPVLFAKIKVTSRPGVDKGDIPFEVLALPAEWNKDWNGGAVKTLNFSDAPIPTSFFVKGDRKGRKDLQVLIDVPAELEVKDAYCPCGRCWEALKPSATPFVTNGVDYVRYVFEKLELFKAMDVASFKVDEGASISLVLGPKAGRENLEKSFVIYYRPTLGGKRGQEKSLEMAFRPLPKGLKRAKDFRVFSWNNADRHFASDAAANAAFTAYEAAGIMSFRKTANGSLSFGRQKELVKLLEKRPVKYVFSGRFGDLWRLGACGLGKEQAKELGVRMAVSSDPAYDGSAKGKMCPEYYTKDPAFNAYLKDRVQSVLAQSGVSDGDWVTFDMEPWHSSTWCHCDECHKAFAAFAGLDHVPTAAETQGEALRDQWANFRCAHNEKSVELLVKYIRAYNPTLRCVDYDYVMPYGDEEGMKARRRACGKDTLENEKWLDGHLCSYYHKIGKDAFDAMRNDTRHLKKFYVPMAALCGSGSYLRQGEVLNPRQFHQFALAAFVNGCRGYAFYAGNCYDGEILVEMMKAQDVVATWEDLPWGKVDGNAYASSASDQFAYASTVRPDGSEVVALFNYDTDLAIKAELAGTVYDLAPLEVKFVTVRGDETERLAYGAAKENDALQARLSDRVSLADYRAKVRTVNGTNVWTEALQAALNEHEIVVIPPAAEPYVLDDTVTVPSDRRIEATGATVRLMDGVTVLMLRNVNTRDGTCAPVPAGARDRNIAVVGGVWEDCSTFRRGYGHSGRYDETVREKGRFFGVSTLFLFNNCDHVSVTDATFRHAGGFAVQAGEGDSYAFRRIRFDLCFADGLHLNGNLSRVLAQDVRGTVGDDLVALNAYDWLNSSVNFGPQRYVLCEDLELVPTERVGYPAIRIQPACYRFADGTVVDCAVSDVVFRRVKGIQTFKMYLQTPRYEIGRDPEWSQVGSGGNLRFEDIEIDLKGPLDMLAGYKTSDPVRGHYGAFEFGANLTSIVFRNVDVAFHLDRYPLGHLATVGPKSAFYPAKDGKPALEIFDPYVSCRVGKVTVEGLKVRGSAPDELVKAVTFDDINKDGRSSGRGVIDSLAISSR